MIDNEKYNTNSQSVGGLLGDIINKNIAIITSIKINNGRKQ